MKKIITLSFLLFTLIPFYSGAQFVLNGSASVTSPECSDSTTTYQLTPNTNTQAGEIWYATQVSLANRFDITFEMYLGTKQYSIGADGICFVFQQLSVNAGSNGGGMGYGGITPSLAVEFDTYQNGWDPAFCHTAIEKNGDVNHTDLSGNNLAGPVQLDPANPNLPDGNWHNMEVVWNPIGDSLSVYYDCIWRLSYTGDVVNSIFGGNPNVFWGFTAGTGGSDNTQEVCLGSTYLNKLRDTTVCEGNPITLTTAGGVSYSWAPNIGLNIDTGISVIATPTSTTTYTVSIKNQCGIISKDSATVVVNPTPTITMGPSTNIICNGQTTGSASVIVTGGAPPYTYLWTPYGGTNSTATDLGAGTYTVTVTGANGCSSPLSTGTVTITQPAAIRDSMTSTSSISCHGGSGTATIGTIGGTGPYTYTWTPGGYTTATVTGLSVGTYTINVTDVNNCPVNPLIVNISEPTALDITIASRTTLLCQGFGYIAAHSATGGTPPYNYVWTPSGGTSIFTTTNLTAGTYTITATDSNGCIATASEIISYPPALLATGNLLNGVSCFGDNTGSASVTASGGTPVYTYSWFPNGGTNSMASGLSAMTYTVTVTDSLGCQATVGVTITQAPGMVIKTDSIDETSFSGCNGLAAVTVVSGTPPYTYLWSPGGESTDTIKGQCAGDYCCTITQGNGCSQTICVVVKNTTGIDNLEPGSGGIIIYPNPNGGEFNIQLPDGSGKSTLMIYNVLGQEVYSQLAIDDSRIAINLREKSAGVYFYRVLREDGSLLGNGKIVIQK